MYNTNRFIAVHNHGVGILWSNMNNSQIIQLF